MKTWQKLVVVALIAALSITAFAGFAVAESADKTVVTAWLGSWWADENERLETGFEEKYPQYDLQIEYLPINNYIENAISSILGGNAPDALALDTLMLGTPIGQGLLEPMDDFYAEYGWAKEDFSQGVLNAGIVDGVTYALPFRTGPIALFYNKTVFDKAGAEYPTDNMKIEDFIELCRKVNDPENGVYAYGIAGSKNDPANVITSFTPFLVDAGGSLLSEDNKTVTINSPESIKGLQNWVDLYTEGLVPEGCINYTFSADLRPMGLNGQLAMVPIDPVNASKADTYAAELGYEYGLCTLPGAASRTGGWHWTIPVGVKNPEGAKAFIDYFLQPEVLSDQNIVQPGVIAAQKLGAWGTEEYDVFWRADATATFVMPVIPTYTEIQNIVITEIQNVLLGEMTVEEATNAMAEQIQPLL